MMTPQEIKSEYYAKGLELGEERHFFDDDTMRWFGDTMSSFSVVELDNQFYMFRKPTATVNVFGKTYSVSKV